MRTPHSSTREWRSSFTLNLRLKYTEHLLKPRARPRIAISLKRWSFLASYVLLKSLALNSLKRSWSGVTLWTSLKGNSVECKNVLSNSEPLSEKKQRTSNFSALWMWQMMSTRTLRNDWSIFHRYYKAKAKKVILHGKRFCLIIQALHEVSQSITTMLLTRSCKEDTFDRNGLFEEDLESTFMKHGLNRTIACFPHLEIYPHDSYIMNMHNVTERNL